jgi:pimeloyl-ACP methyl ester carboxylesterase
MSDHIDVVGGAGGLEVECDDLSSAAHALQLAALDVLDTAFRARTVITDAGLLASSFLNPVGFMRVEAAVLGAVLGPHGLLAAAGRLEERSLSLRAAVLRYLAVDQLDTAWRETRQWAEGTAMMLALPVLPFVALTPVGLAGISWARGGNANAFLAAHPGIAEDAAGAAPTFFGGLLSWGGGSFGVVIELAASGLAGQPVDVSTIEGETALLSLAYPAGSPVVVGRGNDGSAPPAPRGVGDLLSALLHRDQHSHGTGQGEIDVRRLTRAGPDGKLTTSWIVDLPGTKEWQLDPRKRDYLNDVSTNLTTMAGGRSARVEGLTRALELAGVGRDEPVMLVGHSQGGLVAMRAAEQYARDGAFRVTHVVTAGSPIARMDVPDKVSVLALENRYDLVTQLDARPPPAEHNRVTVMLDAQHHDIGLNHAISTAYFPGALAIDAATDDPSLAAWRDGAAAFLPPAGEPASVQTTVWDIRNDR